MINLFYVFIVILSFIVFIFIYFNGKSDISSPKEKAGKQGEFYATNKLKQYLYEDDVLFTNINITYDGRHTELDNVIVNKYGVFIVEVKNYTGRLVGSEDDYEWKKYHTSYGGNVYEKTVKNPIKQVKRQTYILSKYLKYYGFNVWVEGYVYLLYNNSPVEGKCVLEDLAEFSRKIHSSPKNKLTKDSVEGIVKLFYNK